MSITVKDIPALLKADKNVTPFIARAVELAEANPVVSYYCKVYVLEHILTQKLHQNGQDVELFTVSLLDDTEAIKSGHSDASVQQVLQSRQLSINLVFVFAFKLFHACLEDLNEYDGTKPALVAKLRATLNFWALFSIFTDDTEIDYAKTTGGTCSSREQFVAFVKEKTRTLKYQLSRLLKDEVPIKGEETELDQLATELSALDVETDKADEDADIKGDVVQEKEDTDSLDAPFTLPGAPKFNPSNDEEIDLPGAPTYVPDEEPAFKDSTIKVIPLSQERPREPKVQVTQATLGAIADTTEQIGKVQKHAKFAISALNYEDLNTAEAELLKGLELLRSLKNANN